MVLKPIELKGEKNKSLGGGGMSLNIPPAVFGLVPLLVIGGLVGAGVQMQEASLVLTGMGFFALVSIVLFVIMVVSAFKQGDSTAGILILCSIFCPLFGFYMLYWLAVECKSEVAKWMMGSSILMGIVLNVMLIVMPDAFATRP